LIMDPNKSLEKIIVSKTRLSLLRLFFARPKESFYIREVVRLTSEEINSVRRELENLRTAGVLLKEQRGNRLFYFIDQNCLFYQNLLTLVAKTEGIGGKIIKERSRLGEIKFVVFSGHFLRWESNKTEVDFWIVGRVVLPEVGKLVVEEEKKRGREINYAVMDLEEFRLRKRNRDPFLFNVLLNNPVVIFGDEQELAKV